MGLEFANAVLPAVLPGAETSIRPAVAATLLVASSVLRLLVRASAGPPRRQRTRRPPAARTPAGGSEACVVAASGARLFLVGGILTVVNNYLPGSGHLDRSALNLVGVAAIFVGVAVPALPWPRWPKAATLTLVPLALALISTGNLFGGVSPYSYAVYFVVVFTWIGLFFPPRTALRIAPLAIVAYVLPGVLSPTPDVAAVSSVTVAIPICLVVAETIARNVRRAEQRAILLAELARLGRSLADPTADVPGSLASAAVHLGLDAACVLLVDDSSERFSVLGARGLGHDLVGRWLPASDGCFGVEPAARLARRTVVIDDYSGCPLASPELVGAGIRSAMAAPVYVDGVAVAVLSAGKVEKGFSTDEVQAFECLAVQGGLGLQRGFPMRLSHPEALTVPA